MTDIPSTNEIYRSEYDRTEEYLQSIWRASSRRNKHIIYGHVQKLGESRLESINLHSLLKTLELKDLPQS